MTTIETKMRKSGEIDQNMLKIEKRKRERFKEALENWNEYNYINGTSGKYAKDAQFYKEKIDLEISKLKEIL